MSKQRFEFVVEGPPCSANSDDSGRKTDWKQAVGLAAYRQWTLERRSSELLPIPATLEVYVTTYCRDVVYDVDNVLKWTLDGLSATERPQRLNHNQRRIDPLYKNICEDDKQIYKLTSERVEVDIWTQLASQEVSALVYEAIDRYSQPNNPGEFMHLVLVWEESENI